MPRCWNYLQVVRELRPCVRQGLSYIDTGLPQCLCLDIACREHGAALAREGGRVGQGVMAITEEDALDPTERLQGVGE